MPPDVLNTFITGTGHIFIALKSANPTLPVTFADMAALDVAFVDLGHTSKDDAKFSATQTVKDYFSLQGGDVPIDTRQFPGAGTLSGMMLEQKRTTIRAAFGGGTFTDITDGVRWDPPKAGDEPVRFVVVADIVDGDKREVIVIANGVAASAKVDQSFKFGDMLQLPLEIRSLADTVVPAGYYKLIDGPGVESSS